MRFEVLGALRVSDDDVDLHVTRPTQRRLLALLVQALGEPLSTAQLAERLWGWSPPSQATDTLQVHMVGLRKVLGASTIETLPTGYRLPVAGNRVDAVEFSDGFAECLAAIRGDDWDKALEAADRTLAIWRGSPYPDLAGNDHGQPAIVLLEEQHLQLQEMRIRALLALGRSEEAIPALEALAALHPLRERIWQYLMLARYRVGRHAESLSAYQEIRRKLGEELGVEPTLALRQLEEQILLHDPALGVESGQKPPNNLPKARTSFVGRDTDIDVVADLLSRHRYVTLVGGPGVGKSRLAIEAGRGMLDRHPDGTWFVEIQPVASRRDVVAAIAGILGLTESMQDVKRLVEVISAWRGLLILDGADRVPDFALEFTTALASEPTQLRVLSTGRSRLGIPGEITHRVGPLRTPPVNTGVETAMSHPSVHLLIDRVRSVDPGFGLTATNVTDVASLVTELGGVPLAIELAAGWAATLDTTELSALLGVATSGADTVLEAAIDLSYRLLQPDAQQAFRAMSLFVGSFTLEDARFVCSLTEDPFAAASIIARLASTSLIETDHHRGSIRHRLLAPVRQFATRLVEADPAGAVFEAFHDARFLTQCAHAADAIGSDEEVEAFAALDLIMPDVRASWARMLARGDAHPVVRSLASLDRYFFVRFLAWEGRSWLQQALNEVTDDGVRAIGLCALGFLSYIDDDPAQALTLLGKSVELARTSGDPVTDGWALTQLARAQTWSGLDVQSAESSREAMEVFARIPDARGLATAHLWHGINELNWAETPDLTELAEAVEELSAIGDHRLVSVGSRMLADVALWEGRLDEARDWADLARSAADRAEDGYALIGAGVQQSLVKSEAGDLRGAARTLLDAHSRLLGSSEVDAVTVLGWPAVPILLADGKLELALRALSKTDQVYARWGSSIPPSSRGAVARWRLELEGRVDDHDRVVELGRNDDLDALMDEIRSALSALVRG